MAVTTPQLDVPVYQPKEMAVPPGPTGQTAQPLPTSAGYVPKSGAAAYLANNVLQGWLKGREVAKQHELAKAQNNLQGADYAYQTMAKNYNDLLRAGKSEDDPEVQKAKQGATAAWQAKLGVMGQYAMPQDDKTKKKSTKEKVEGGLGAIFGKAGIEPQMIPQASLEILKNSPPPGLGLSPQDRAAMTEQKAAEGQLELQKGQIEEQKRQKQKEAEDDQIQAIIKTNPSQRTPEQTQQLEGWERLQHIKDPETQKFADSVMHKIENGQTLTDTERNFAYTQRLLEGPQREFRTNANGMDQLVTISPDGKVMGSVNLGRHYEPDQVGPAIRLVKAQQMEMFKMFKAAGMSDADAWQNVAIQQSRNPTATAALIGANPKLQEKKLDVVSKAIHAVLGEAGGVGADPDKKKQMIERWSNFISIPQNTDSGLYAFRDQIAPPTTTGFFSKKTTYAGGMTPAEEAAEQAAFYNRVRVQLQRQNPKMSTIELDAMLPEWLKNPAAAPMAPPPEQDGGLMHFLKKGLGFASEDPTMRPPPLGASAAPAGVGGTPGPGKKVYQVKTDDRGWVPYYMTDADAAQAAQSGFQTVEGSAPPAGQ